MCVRKNKRCVCVCVCVCARVRVLCVRVCVRERATRALMGPQQTTCYSQGQQHNGDRWVRTNQPHTPQHEPPHSQTVSKPQKTRRRRRTPRGYGTVAGPSDIASHNRRIEVVPADHDRIAIVSLHCQVQQLHKLGASTPAMSQSGNVTTTTTTTTTTGTHRKVLSTPKRAMLHTPCHTRSLHRAANHLPTVFTNGAVLAHHRRQTRR